LAAAPHGRGAASRWVRRTAAGAVLVGLLAGAAREPAPAAAPGNGHAGAPSSWWHGLGLRDLNGAPLDPPARWFVVVFLGQECPVSNLSIPVLNRLADEFSPRGFAFVGAYVDPNAGLGELRSHAAEYAVRFPAADDREHRLVRVAGATYTPEVAVFSAAGVKLYDGRIDDRVGSLGAARPAATRQELREVLIALAAGSAGPFPGKPGYGCAIPEGVRP
jgi:hypothetical protein